METFTPSEIYKMRAASQELIQFPLRRKGELGLSLRLWILGRRDMTTSEFQPDYKILWCNFSWWLRSRVNANWHSVQHIEAVNALGSWVEFCCIFLHCIAPSQAFAVSLQPCTPILFISLPRLVKEQTEQLFSSERKSLEHRKLCRAYVHCIHYSFTLRIL